MDRNLVNKYFYRCVTRIICVYIKQNICSHIMMYGNIEGKWVNNVDSEYYQIKVSQSSAISSYSFRIHIEFLVN